MWKDNVVNNMLGSKKIKTDKKSKNFEDEHDWDCEYDSNFGV